MRIKRIRVKNFRSLKDAEMDCDKLTVLVGANGTGKSNILKAIKLFQGQDSIERDDYYECDTGNDATIEIVFDDIHDKAPFGQYVHKGEMSIRQVFAWSGNKAQQTFRGRRMQHEGFDAIRAANTATEAKEEYRRLPKEYALPTWSRREKALNDIRTWENQHPNQCKLSYDDGEFFTKNKIQNEILQAIFIPAVHDAAVEAEDARNSSLAQLMKKIVDTIEEDDEYQKFKLDAERKYGKLMERFRRNQLQEKGREITKELKTLTEGVEVQLSWQDADLAISLPHTTAKIKEEGSLSTVGRSGHGSQRMFIMAMLQHLAKYAESSTQERGQPASILLIEEPELYQHPTRQRIIVRVFDSLAERGGMQIMHATHSPHFVGIDRIDHVRLLRKRKQRAGHHTEISHTSIRAMYERLKDLGANKDEKYLKELLGVIMTPWINEGFFASLVVLVEGQTDYAAIMAASRLAGEDMEKSGIAVIPCGGKDNMLPLVVMFRLLRIPCYPVWDGDKQGDPLNGKIWQAVESANTQPGIADEGACLERNLDQTLEREIGKDLLDRLIDKAKHRYHISGTHKQVMSKSRIMHDILEAAAAEDKPCESLNKIVKHIKQAYAARQEEPWRTRAKRRR